MNLVGWLSQHHKQPVKIKLPRDFHTLVSLAGNQQLRMKGLWRANIKGVFASPKLSYPMIGILNL